MHITACHNQNDGVLLHEHQHGAERGHVQASRARW